MLKWPMEALTMSATLVVCHRAGDETPLYSPVASFAPGVGNQATTAEHVLIPAHELLFRRKRKRSHLRMNASANRENIWRNPARPERRLLQGATAATRRITWMTMEAQRKSRQPVWSSVQFAAREGIIVAHALLKSMRMTGLVVAQGETCRKRPVNPLRRQSVHARGNRTGLLLVLTRRTRGRMGLRKDGEAGAGVEAERLTTRNLRHAPPVAAAETTRIRRVRHCRKRPAWTHHRNRKQDPSFHH